MYKIIKSIKQLRTELGITQKELAKETGILQCSISQWECGKWEMNMKNYKKLVEFANKHGYLLDL